MSATEFRTQLGGYNKEDVNKFIKDRDNAHFAQVEELRNRYNEALGTNAELEEKIKSLEDGNAKLTESLEAAKCAYAAKETELEGRAADAENAARQCSDKLAAFTEEKTAFEARIAKLEAELKELTVKAEEVNNRYASVSAEYASAMNENEVLRTENTVIRGENEKLTDEISALRASIDEAEKHAKAQSDPNDIESDAYKLNMYNKLSGQLSDIIINANKSARDITAAAVAEADKLREDTTLACEEKMRNCDASIAETKAETAEEAQYIRERLSKTANELLANVSADLHGSVENCVREINSCISEMQYELRTLLSKISDHTVDMNDKISYYQSCVSDGIESRLTAMDEKYGIVPNSAASKK